MKNRGLSLIELVVGMGALSISLVMFTRVISSSQKDIKKIEAKFYSSEIISEVKDLLGDTETCRANFQGLSPVSTTSLDFLKKRDGTTSRFVTSTFDANRSYASNTLKILKLDFGGDFKPFGAGTRSGVIPFEIQLQNQINQNEVFTNKFYLFSTLDVTNTLDSCYIVADELLASTIWQPSADGEGIYLNGYYQIGLGTNSPRGLFDVQNENWPEDPGFGRFGNGAADNGINLNFYRTRGAIAAPTAVLTDDLLMSIEGHGHDGDEFLSIGGIQLKSDMDATVGNLTSRFEFYTHDADAGKKNAPDLQMLIKSTGQLGIDHDNPQGVLSIGEFADGRTKFTITDDQKMGIGITNPEYQIDIRTNLGRDFVVYNYTDGYNSGADYEIGRARGTLGSRSKPIAGDTLGKFAFRTWSGTGFQETANIEFVAENNNSDADLESRVEINLGQGDGTTPTTPKTQMIIDSRSKVAVGDMSNPANLTDFNAPGQTATLRVYGGIHTTGPIITPSDIKLKKDIHSLTSILKRLKKVGAYSYERKETGKREIGVIAQDIEKQFPYLIGKTSAEEMKSLSYEEIVPLIIRGLQELYEVYELRKLKLEKQKEKLKTLKRKISHNETQ